MKPLHTVLNTLLAIVAITLSACVVGPAYGSARQAAAGGSSPAEKAPAAAVEGLSVAPADSATRFTALTDADYAAVAQELGITPACIKAVVEIETGNKCNGFNPDHTPIINFDINMFRKYARVNKVNLAPYVSKYADVFAKPNVQKYGSLQKAQYVRLEHAMAIDTVTALEGTFWGMFQIGGFNWKLCGCSSVQEFVARMAYSEREQLELFAAFVRDRKLDVYLQRRDWAGFALRYNGPGYKRLHYDTRMAKAYQKYKK